MIMRGPPPHSSSLFWSIWGPPSLMSPVMVNISPPAIINPCYGQYSTSSHYQALLWSIYHQLVAVASLLSIIHCTQPLLWSICYQLVAVRHYLALFTAYNPWYGQFFHHLGALMCS